MFPTADNGCSMSENRRAELAGAFQRGLDFCLQEFPRNETVQIRILASVFDDHFVSRFRQQSIVLGAPFHRPAIACMTTSLSIIAGLLQRRMSIAIVCLMSR